MWRQYLKTLPIVQAFILGMCLVGFYVLKMSWLPLLVLFLVMQVASLLSTWWTYRLEQAIRKRQAGTLPLQRRRGL